MKKVLLFSLVLLTMFSAKVVTTSACRFVQPGPKVEDTIKEGGSIFIGKVLDSGEKSAGEVLRVERGDVPDKVDLVTRKDSCSIRFEDFIKGEYFLAITPEGEESSLTNSDGDKEFTYYFETANEAEAMIVELYKKSDTVKYTKPFRYTPISYILRPNTRGEDVRNLQRGLNQVVGHDLFIDGIYGKDTRNTVLYFQSVMGLATDGIAGPITQEALGKSTAPVTTYNNINYSGFGIGSIQACKAGEKEVYLIGSYKKDNASRYVVSKDLVLEGECSGASEISDKFCLALTECQSIYKASYSTSEQKVNVISSAPEGQSLVDKLQAGN
jgi:peptidoglycan hydrolase-like protein with peptidoglycan-binding domain